MIYFFQYIPPLYSSYAILFTTKYINLSYVSLCENNFKTFEKTYPYLKPQKTISQNRPLFYFTQKQKNKNHTHYTPPHRLYTFHPLAHHPISTTPNTKYPPTHKTPKNNTPLHLHTHSILSRYISTQPHNHSLTTHICC